MDEFLSENEVMPLSHPAVRQYTFEHVKGDSNSEKAIALYYTIRDGIWYDPFDIRFEVEALRADCVIEKGRGHCVDKAVLFVTCCRIAGIPARLGLARVRNHMGTARLEQVLRTDVLAPHGYAEVYLNDRWVKCTPAFNKTLCDRLGVSTLEFDGVHDSVFQAYDREEGGFMEYLDDYGSFASLPTELLKKVMQKEYPHLFNDAGVFNSDALKMP